MDKNRYFRHGAAWLVALAALFGTSAYAAEGQKSEQELIAVLRSGAPADKARRSRSSSVASVLRTATSSRFTAQISASLSIVRRLCRSGRALSIALSRSKIA